MSNSSSSIPPQRYVLIDAGYFIGRQTRWWRPRASPRRRWGIYKNNPTTENYSKYIESCAKELKKDIGENSEYSKDIDLLISQTKRCSEILKKISSKQIEDDQFISSIKTEDLIEEIINSFRETSSKEINLICDEDKNKINIKRTPEIIYGFRNFIGNAIKFSKSKVSIYLK